MAVNVEVIRRITTQARVEGEQQATAAFDRMRVKLGDVSASAEDAAKGMLSNENAVKRARRAYEDNFATIEKLARLQKDLTVGVAAGRIEQGQANLIFGIAAEKLTGMADQMEKAAKANLANARATIQAREAQAAMNREMAASSQRNIGTNLGFRAAPDVAGRAEDFEAALAAADKMRAKYDQVFAAEQKLAAATDEINQLQRAGVLTTEMAAKAIGDQTRAYENQLDVLNGVVAARENAARSAVMEARATIQQRQAQVDLDRETASNSQRNLASNLGLRAAPDVEGRGADVEAAFAAADKLRAKYDEVFRAEMKLADATREINELQAAGVLSPERAAAAIEKENAAYQDQLNVINGVTAAQDRLASAAENQAKRQAQAWANLKGDGAAMAASGNASRSLGNLSSDGTVQLTAAARSLRAELVPLAAAEEQYAAAVMKADAAVKAGVINESERNAAVARASGTLLNQRNEINKATQAHERMAKGAGLNAYALTNLSYQVNDVATSLASGISPMQTFAQQGGQIFQILQSDQGGVRGGLKSIGDLIKGIATPGRLMFAGLATGAAAAAYALYSYNAEQTKLRQNVSGIGRASGATVGSINALAPDAGRAAGVSTSQAREMAGTFAATGRIGQEMYAGLIKGAKDYATLTGTDVADATKEFADAFANPSEGALKLNKTLGFLNFTTLENIRAMEQSGDRLGAQRLLLEASASATAKASEKLGFFAKQWEDFKNTTSNEIGGIGSFINKGLGMEDAEARVKTLQGQLDFRASRKGSMGGLFDSLWGFDEDQIRQDLAKAKAEVAKAQADGKKTALDQRGLEIGELVKGLNPASESLKKMERDAANIRTYFRELGVDPFGPAKATMEGLERSAKQLKEDMAAGGAAFADATRQAKFENKTVGFTEFGRGAAEIEQNALNRGIQANREFQTNNNGDQYQKALASIENDRVMALDTLNKKTQLAEQNLGSSFSRLSGAVQQQVLQAGQMFGKVSPGLIAAIAGKESGGNASVGYAKIPGENGKPSSAYGLGQITKGTAEEAVKAGYLPPGFDRMNESTMAQGIAGVLAMKIDQAGGDVTKGLMNYRGSKNPEINRAYAAEALRKAGQMGDASQLGIVRETDANAQALKTLNDQLANNRKNYGDNGALLEANDKAIQQYNATLARGVPASEELRKSIEATAMASVTAGQQIKLNTYRKDSQFEMDQLGRATADQPAYAKARGLFGDTTSEASKFVIQQEKLNDNLRVTRQLGGEAFSGFLTDISHGTNALTALTSALTRMFDKLLSAAGDKIFSGIFGSLLGGDSKAGGGFLSGIFGLPKFAKGGIATGPSILGEAGPEAAVPLPDGRRIPVDLGPASNTNMPRPIQVAVGDSYLEVKPADGVTPEQLREILKSERAENARTIGQQLSTWKENN